MDEQTFAAYERDAPKIAARHRSGAHERLHEVLREYFRPGEATADIGTGSGRDLAWLVANGFPAIGYEPSSAMRREAMTAYPTIQIHDAALPALETVADASFANVLCSAVLMHLPEQSLPTALRNLGRILRPRGRLVITVRTSMEVGERETDGRLFTPIDPEHVATLLAELNVRVLQTERDENPRQPGAIWTMIVAEKPVAPW